MLLAGLLAKALGSLTHVPGITLLLLLGAAAGPLGFDVLPAERETWFPVLARVALVQVGFLLGHQFTRESLRARGHSVLLISLCDALVSAACVALGLALLGVSLAMALLLGVIAAATAPAASISVVRELRAEGPFSDTLLGIVAVDDVWGLTLFSLVLPVSAWLAGSGGGGELALLGLRELGGGLLLGLLLGVPMALLTGRLRAGEPTLLKALGFVLLCGGLAGWLQVSYLLAAVVMGATVANLARHHERHFHEIEGIDAPFLLLFFVLAGASLELDALAQAGAALAASYVALRVLGRLIGAGLGARLAGAPPLTRRWIGPALLPQAGVALGLALAVDERFPELGAGILPVVVVATTFFEIVGPLVTRLALRRVGEARV